MRRRNKYSSTAIKMNFVANSSQNSQNSDDLDDLLDLNSPPSYSSNISSLLSTPAYPLKLFLSQHFRANSNSDSGFSFTQSSFGQNQSFHRQFSKTERVFSSQSTASVSSSDSFDLPKKWSTQNNNHFRKEEKPLESKRPRTLWINAENNDSSSLTQTPSFLQSPKSPFQFLERNEASGGQDTNLISNILNDPSEESTTSFHMNELSQEIENSQKEIHPNCELANEADDEDEEESENGPASSDLNRTNQNDEQQPIVNPDQNEGLSVLPAIQPILNLFTKVKSQHSDCAFVHALAAHTCKDIYPKHSYISLKTALLLSIVSCNVSLNSIHFFSFIMLLIC